jgi:hypothetical protein
MKMSLQFRNFQLLGLCTSSSVSSHYLHELHYGHLACSCAVYNNGSECLWRNKMAGSVVAVCLLLLVPSACRGGLSQEEKYTTRSDFPCCGYTNPVPTLMWHFCVAVTNCTCGYGHRRSLIRKKVLCGDNCSSCLCPSVCNLTPTISLFVVLLKVLCIRVFLKGCRASLNFMKIGSVTESLNFVKIGSVTESLNFVKIGSVTASLNFVKIGSVTVTPYINEYLHVVSKFTH